MASYNIPSVVILSTHFKDGSYIARGILDCVPLPLSAGSSTLPLSASSSTLPLSADSSTLPLSADSSTLPLSASSSTDVEVWPWHVDNKYYSADVQLMSVSNSHDRNLPMIMQSGEAVLIYCDASQCDVIPCINELLENIGDYEPEVLMLVCDSCKSEQDNTSGLSRLEAQKWCIVNGWELIELNQEQDEIDSDYEDDFPESFGFNRICKALHAHTWSNLVMKDNHGGILNCVLQSVSTLDTAGSLEFTEKSEEIMYNRLSEMNINQEECVFNNKDEEDIEGELEGMLDPSLLEGCVTLEGENCQFEHLFSNFEQLKQNASNLPPEQRRDYAEKVAVAFWRAIGGHEDEIDGIDSD